MGELVRMAHGLAGFRVTINGLADASGVSREAIRRALVSNGVHRHVDDDSAHARFELAEIVACMGDETGERIARLERHRLAIYADRLLAHLSQRSRVPREIMTGVAYLAGAAQLAIAGDEHALPLDWLQQIDQAAEAAAAELAPAPRKRKNT